MAADPNSYEKLRLQALQLAIELASTYGFGTDDVLKQAREFYKFLRDG